MSETQPTPTEGGRSLQSPDEVAMNGLSQPDSGLQGTSDAMRRSSSVASNHSAASATTATSRRGGRIRSRSPPVVTGRPLSTAPSERNHITSPKNPPSSAAAAAAAAAKALSNGAGGQTVWYGHDSQGRHHDQSKYQYNNSSHPGSTRWPHPERNGRMSSGSPNQETYGQPDHGQYVQRSSFGGSQGNVFQPSQPRQRQTGRLPPHATPSSYASQHHEQPINGPYGSPRDGQSGHDASTPSTVERSGTSRVLGTPTPIHVPRANLTSSHSVADGSAASVFRDPPGGGMTSAPTTSQFDEDSPSKILMSLRTPSHSFEERDSPHKNSLEGESKKSLSPDGPPRIQNAHHQVPSMDIFERKRSPNGGSLEMAHSFNLFNTSFDSLGDTGSYLPAPIDASLQTHSFGVQQSGSEENAQTLASAMHLGASQGLGSSPSGTLTLGMSPVNSFGNGAPAGHSRRAGNMMVVGGGDPHSSSPTQVLGMYPSFSSGGLPQSHMQYRGGHMMANDPYVRSMGSGSFGGPSMTMSQTYTRSFEQSPHSPYGPPGMMHNSSVDGPDGQPHFYGFLRRNKAAFIKCSFLLPGLKAALLESPLSNSTSGGPDSRKLHPLLRGRMFEPTPQDTAIASRRIVSAIFAFGGSVGGDSTHNVKVESSSQSIFRDEDGAAKPATVTPSSTTGTPPGARFQSRSRMKYEEMLPNRYYENENRLSWEFEESPPIEGTDEKKGTDRKTTKAIKQGGQHGEVNSSHISSPDSTKMILSDEASKSSVGSPGSEQRGGSKMRYRCKLCGQPKQNHVCAYMKSLQRSIGAMVYPAVNAFTANEPGLLTPALTEMNNFMPSGSESNPSSNENSPTRPGHGENSNQTSTPKRKAKNVTPETMRSSSPVSNTSPSRVMRTPKRRKTGGQTQGNFSGGSVVSHRPTPQSARSHVQQLVSGGSDEHDLLFVEAIDLKPEQFREVSASKFYPPADAFNYPSLPLPYAQRKRLSDNLFALSKEVPKLTDECAVVLREAREKDMWDLAVAELMTQVVVVIHCPEHDTRFEGLRQYLLTLGIAC